MISSTIEIKAPPSRVREVVSTLTPHLIPFIHPSIFTLYIPHLIPFYTLLSPSPPFSSSPPIPVPTHKYTLPLFQVNQNQIQTQTQTQFSILKNKKH